MPSMPLSPERSAVVKLHTRLQVEAIDIVKGRTDYVPAVVRLCALVPPARVDLVTATMVNVGRFTKDKVPWPPPGVMYELVYRVGRVHRGDIALVGPDGVTVQVVDFVDTAGRHRQVYRVLRDGKLVKNCKTAAELDQLVPLGELAEQGEHAGRA